MPLPIGPIVAGAVARAGAKKAAQRAVVTVKKTKSGIKKTGSVSKMKSEIESTSYRGKELTKSERKKIREQNRAAESAKSKDLDRVESGKVGAQTKKRNQRRRELGMYAKGAAGGLTGGAVLTSGLYAIANKDKDKKKSTKKKK